MWGEREPGTHCICVSTTLCTEREQLYYILIQLNGLPRLLMSAITETLSDHDFCLGKAQLAAKTTNKN